MPFRRRHLKRHGRLVHHHAHFAAPVHLAADPHRPLWLVEGLKYIGTHEFPGSANNPKIIRMAQRAGFRGYRSDSIPWCSLFGNFCLTSAGFPGTGSLLALSFNQSKNLVRLPGPAVGAFVPMKRLGGGHIAIIVGRNSSGSLMCLGGNQSNMVSIKSFPLARALSFRWPRSAKLPGVYGFKNLPLIR